VFFFKGVSLSSGQTIIFFQFLEFPFSKSIFGGLFREISRIFALFVGTTAERPQKSRKFSKFSKKKRKFWHFFSGRRLRAFFRACLGTKNCTKNHKISLNFRKSDHFFHFRTKFVARDAFPDLGVQTTISGVQNAISGVPNQSQPIPDRQPDLPAKPGNPPDLPDPSQICQPNQEIRQICQICQPNQEIRQICQISQPNQEIPDQPAKPGNPRQTARSASQTRQTS